MKRRVGVTVSRNDARPYGFKRWTVYAQGRPIYDIEATGTDRGVMIHVVDAQDSRPKKVLAFYDGRRTLTGGVE